MRKLGIPTVVDRVVQQAIHQILSPIFEKQFSEFLVMVLDQKEAARWQLLKAWSF
ncbi:hypothetical protein ACPA2L_30405 [Bacillus bombysepticus]